MTKIDMTPTVILVDKNRRIRASYEGMLLNKQEQDLFELFDKITSVQDAE